MNRQAKWMAAALALSVAANIFFIGFSVGKGMFGIKNTRPPSHAAGLNARALGRYLDADQRMEMRAIIKTERREIRRNFMRLRNNEHAIRNALRAPKVDEQTLNTLLEQHEQLVTGSRAGIQRKLFTYMATLPLDTRTKIAADLFRPRARHGFRDGRSSPSARRNDAHAAPPILDDEQTPRPD